jgi:5-methylcytosine-specific restriction enzyme A
VDAETHYRDPAIKRMYNSKEWRRLRLAQLEAHPWCAECLKKDVKRRATEVDHIEPHHGNEKLFFDPRNLQSLDHRCHTKKTDQERA